MTSQHQEHQSSSFNNDHLKVEVSEQPHCRVLLDITVSPQGTQASYQKALKNINKEVSIPGFRKGRAPTSLIQTHYSKAILSEFQDVTLQIGFSEAITLAKLHPLKNGYVSRPKIQECSLEKGAHFSVEIEVFPTIPSVNLDDLAIEQPPKPVVTDEEIDNALWQVRREHATFEEIADRPIQENDFIDLTLTFLIDPPQEPHHYPKAHVNSKGLPVWLLNSVIGLNVDESAEGTQNLSDDDDNEQKPIPYLVTVNKIYEGTLPELDDELAKSKGVQTLEKLKGKIREQFSNDIEEEFWDVEVKKLEDHLYQKYPFSIPKSFIEARASYYLEQLKQDQQSGIGKQPSEEVRQRFEQHSERHLVLSYLLQKVVADHQIKPNDAEIQQEWLHQYKLLLKGKNQINIFSKEDNREELLSLALTRKTKQFLLDHTKRLA